MPKRNGGTNTTLEKFTGKERDTEGNLNLDYFGARYYDPALGRWISADPFADKYPSWSPYTYTLDNPIVFFDPDGRDVRPIRLKNRPTISGGIAKIRQGNILEGVGDVVFSSLLAVNEFFGGPDPLSVDPNPISGGTKAAVKVGSSLIMKGLAS